MPQLGSYKEEYGKLNKEQKEAVETTEGPVMVVAGPGTGKTQILALRIGNILSKTDTKSSDILCLTFTNSAVKAMKERLRHYIGGEATNVKVATFHGFGMEILEKYYSVLGLSAQPELLDEKDSIALYDGILQKNDWELIRPRSEASRYFRDLKSMISFLKRERVSAEALGENIEKEIENIKNDPDNISSRGESKGNLKKEVLKKIESLERTQEAVKFYGFYEEAKKAGNFFDYDDILEALVKIVEDSEEARNYIKENYLYVLIDEHQDSSGVQNEFLKSVWGEEENPNIFVVGDDRQLIYGFGGASLQYFENFKHAFGEAKLITLVENYRSTQKILDSGDLLLQSSISKGKLKSNHKENHSLRLVEAYYPRDEIISIALEIKERIKNGAVKNDMAILVPKNRQVRSTVAILKDMGIEVAGGDSLNFFDSHETISLLRVLKIMSDPDNGVALSQSFFDPNSGVSPFKAHAFLKENKMREFSLLSVEPEKSSLFDEVSGVNNWIEKLKFWLENSSEPLYTFIQRVGTEFLLDTAKNHKELVARIEVLRTLFHITLHEIEKNPRLTLSEFLSFLKRIEDYKENIPLVVFSPDEGVKVLTLHGSKGLEFDYLWIAHMNERSFSGSKRDSFSLPESIKEKLERRDEIVLKRELYVAITRAKRFCTVSYARRSHAGAEQEITHIMKEITENFEKQSAEETEKIILERDQKAYVAFSDKKISPTNKKELIKLVAQDYPDRKVSVSLLNNFFECPWKWYFRNLLQLPEPKTESLEFGNIVHGSIDQILKKEEEISNREIEDIILVQIRKSGFGDERKQKELFALALKTISRWFESRYSQISKKRENEQSVSVNDARFPHLNIYGKIDLLEKLDKDNVRVTDFKTGSVRKKSDIEKIDEEGRMSTYMRQLAMYSYLIKQNKKWKVDVRESRLEFVEAKNNKEEFYDTVIGEGQIDSIVKDITDYDKLVKEGEWIDRLCNYNSYGQNTECEYCRRSEIYK
ncbi:MAG: ATP-dependent DNA helicase [Candidatus Paceibacterota bacterium]